MSRSYSSLLRSIPVYQAQLNKTDLRSCAPAAGVYGGAPAPRPPRPFWLSPAAGAAPCPRACAKALVDAAQTVKATPIAILVQVMLLRKFMAISRFVFLESLGFPAEMFTTRPSGTVIDVRSPSGIIRQRICAS